MLRNTSDGDVYWQTSPQKTTTECIEPGRYAVYTAAPYPQLLGLVVKLPGRRGWRAERGTAFCADGLPTRQRAARAVYYNYLSGIS